MLAVVPALVATAVDVGSDIRRANQDSWGANNLCAAARLIVEQLIEGTLSESDLITAQKALEAGDRSADRAILQSLRRGDAPDAPPLFPDLDALYALLDALEEETPR